MVAILLTKKRRLASGVGSILVILGCRGEARGLGKPPPPKFFDYQILKWHILMHTSGNRHARTFLKFCFAT